MKKSRPTMLTGATFKVPTSCGNMYITLNGDESGVFEVFAALGKSGTCGKVQSEALTRVITLALKHGAGVDEVVDELCNLRCQSPLMYPEESRVLSCPDAIAKVLKDYENTETS